MKKVNIYLASSVKSPRQKRGKVGFVMEYVTKSQLVATKTEFMEVKDVSVQQAEMACLLKALLYLKEPCELSVYSDTIILKRGIDKQEEWSAAGFEDVKDALGWRMLYMALEKHEITFFVDNNHEYKSWLKNEVKKMP